MFSGNSALFAVVLSSLSLAHSASAEAPKPAGPAIPQCAANCMSIKIKEAAVWFGASQVSEYCKHPEFLLAYNTCLHDNCKPEEIDAGKQAGLSACPGAPTNGAPAGPPGGNSTAAGDVNNSTAHLSGPADAPGGANSTLVPAKGGSNPGQAVNTPNTPGGLNGALPPSGANATNTTTSAPSRFSGAVGSAAANASSQAGDASAISSSTTILFTALSSCALSLFL
ncbi:hypothetical protein PTTG_08198 [Puccinia triticina 1-1 BBBD Race 1]|uniref:CFEM domain-containing protein n=1 Tax=Puccinia triticina (isolate 1-1 / race 1 (BBBD)) TaxID=630390 RepID=A0A180G6V3_PUCT1|nr:hypothetical protein PTTG_08198 [Puccinia triticina 1-1 BBBD Race 1]